MYDRKKEYKKWKRKKELDEQRLKAKGVSDEYIEVLREMDKLMFNQERSFKRYQFVTKDVFFLSTPDNRNYKTYITLNDILDDIENEVLLNIFLEADELAKKIIEMRYQGYNVREISQYLKISNHKIYRIIRNIKEKYKSMQKR